MLLEKKNMKYRSYWFLGTGLVVFLIGSYMYVSWNLGLCIISCTQDFFKVGNFTFEKFAAGTAGLFACPRPRTMFDSPPCAMDLAKFDYASMYLWLPLIVWVAGVSLFAVSLHEIIHSRRKEDRRVVR
jgi:bacteriorhodopsin